MKIRRLRRMKRIGCLLIHGFGGSVYEVSPLAEYLENKGCGVICPTLKGHTGRKKDLRGITYHDWLDSAEIGLKELMQSHEHIVIIGFSMGGLIGINLASKYKVNELITINTPIYYWDFKRIYSNIIRDFKNKEYGNIRRYVKSSGNTTLSALLHFKLLLTKTKSMIRGIKCPVFVTQALDDDTVRKQSAHYIHDRVESKRKKLRFYDQGGHLILRSPSAAKVMEDIWGCITEIELYK
jgi:carboxylesterase